MDELLSKVKANLILEHTADDALLKSYITAASFHQAAFIFRSWMPSGRMILPSTRSVATKPT